MITNKTTNNSKSMLVDKIKTTSLEDEVKDNSKNELELLDKFLIFYNSKELVFQTRSEIIESDYNDATYVIMKYIIVKDPDGLYSRKTKKIISNSILTIYQEISNEQMKNFLRENIPILRKTKYITLEAKMEHMSLESKINIARIATDVALNFTKVKRIIYDEDITDIKDVDKITKIYRYYISACFARDYCKDTQTYNYLRNKSISEYKTLENNESKQILSKYIGQQFLNKKRNNTST